MKPAPDRPSDLTSYPEVNALLQELLSRVREILGDRFVGMYLYGSLASGDFDPDRSDIDFVVVTTEELPGEAIADLEAMHAALATGTSKWAEKLEGAYIPLHSLRRYDPGHAPVPTINEGRFYVARQGSDWVIQRHVLREQGAVVAGPSLRPSIDPVEPGDLRQGVRDLLQEWWEPMLQESARLRAAHYRPYAVLTMCRALHTLEHGTVVPKTEAAEWAKDALDPGWRDLIEAALSWRGGGQLLDLDRTIDFVRLAIDRAKQARASTGRVTTGG